MTPIADLVQDQVIKKLATPANYQKGQEIAASGGVELVEFGPLRVEAKVKGDESRRTVNFQSTGDGLKWKCTCTNDPDLFCQHCVAAAVATLDRSEEREA